MTETQGVLMEMTGKFQKKKKKKEKKEKRKKEG